MYDREKVIKELDKLVDEVNPWKESPPLRCDIPYPLLCDALAMLKKQSEIIRCKDCKWYDERISMCDNCGLPREQTFFCADGKRREGCEVNG